MNIQLLRPRKLTNGNTERTLALDADKNDVTDIKVEAWWNPKIAKTMFTLRGVEQAIDPIDGDFNISDVSVIIAKLENGKYKVQTDPTDPMVDTGKLLPGVKMVYNESADGF